VPVRVYFRGLILFRFPTKGDDAGKLVAELITAPLAGKQPPAHDHEPEILVVTGGARPVPANLQRGTTVAIDAAGARGVQRSQSFIDHVPRLSRLAAKTTPHLKRGTPNPRYVRNTVIINRGVARVKDVVIWDAGGFPLTGAVGGLPSTAAEVKFMACNSEGHAANECVVDIPDASEVEISGTEPSLKGRFRSIGRRNQHGSANTVEIMVRNYEIQREKPVPWGLDFQWLFLRAGYIPINLAGAEFTSFDAFATRYDAGLYGEDRAELLPGTEGLPFPYVRESALTRLRPLTDIDSRPVCVPGEDDDGS
jgi:hypothetical protein